MRSKKTRPILIVAVCALLVLALMYFTFGGTPRESEYISEYGTRYFIDREEIVRLDVPVELSVGEESKEFSVNVVYAYSIYSKDFEERIAMRLVRVEYEGEDGALKNLIASLNRDIAGGSASKYEFGNLTLKASTDGEYARGAGNVRINGELVKREK